jgi:hypothetical protein
MGFFILLVIGDQIFAAIGQPKPAFFEKIQENKWMYGIAVFFVGNSIS